MLFDILFTHMPLKMHRGSQVLIKSLRTIRDIVFMYYMHIAHCQLYFAD